MSLSRLVVCDSSNNAIVVPELLMAGAENGQVRAPDAAELLTLPASAQLFILPGRFPVGVDPKTNRRIAITEYRGTPVFAASAFLPPGYIQTLTSAYAASPGAPRLPLFCYTALGWRDGRFVAAATRIDRQRRHTLSCSEIEIVDRCAASLIKRHPDNRLIDHLVNNCALNYRCPNACNLVLGRWECPVPVSRRCNASCLGCISAQSKRSRVPSTQHRISFTPTADEIIDYAVPHLIQASKPIVSFGQGCEGEPLLEADLIEKAIVEIRKQTKRGVINLNTNGSLPSSVERLCKAGLNSIRISLNSAQHDFYRAYYRPKGYSFEDVVESIRIARDNKIWVSLNYLVFPGFTDSRKEMTALFKLLARGGVNMIQARNLNIDPAWYAEELGLSKLKGKAIGIRGWIGAVRGYFPAVKLGYFNPA